MTPRAGPLFVAATLLATVAFAGCGAPSPATARAGLAVAEARAAAFHPDARLSQVVGVEATSMPKGGDEGAVQKAMVTATDPSPGDGLARTWLYRFETPDGPFLVAVGGGKVRYEGATTTNEARAPLGEWSIDSDEAAGAALSERSYADAIEGGVVMQLEVTPSGQAAWQFTAGAGVAYVDATTGAIVPPKVAEIEPLPLRREAGVMGGTVALVGEPAIDEFSITQEGHQALTLAAEIQNPLVQGITVHFAVPGGAVHDIAVAASDPTQPVAVAYLNLTSAPTGLYHVTYSLDTGASVNYRFMWCSDGLPVIKDPANRACVARGDR